MGSYLNPGNEMFRRSRNSQIYVDKSGLIDKMNKMIRTEQRYVCVSRPRRFGKSMAANMLAAYYDCSVDSAPLFEDLQIAGEESYRSNLNRYNVLQINMQEFLSVAHDVGAMLKLLQKRILQDLKWSYPDFIFEDSLIFSMKDIYAHTGQAFVILIDEWDCMFREFQNDKESQKKYLDFLRAWLKDQQYVALAYMTGILPVKKYGTHSALNMFTEYSMVNPREFAPYFGFTEEEVRSLCRAYNQCFEETQAWYDGYALLAVESGQKKWFSMYNPKSVVEAMLSGIFENYWNETETYEALKVYIQMNYDGLRDAVTRMLAGGSVSVNTGTFSNDMTSMEGRDDVLTLLVHLGYLNYNQLDKTVRIPNKEVSQEYVNAIGRLGWNEVIRSVEDSKKLLEALWNRDEAAVAAGVEQSHNEISILEYNDENSLSCTVSLAFYFAREYYTIIRELPAGKGFADIAFIPRKAYADKPAVLIELKRNDSAEGAIAQIRERNYTEALKEYQGSLLLAGINYDAGTKKHTCKIESYVKG